MDVSHEKVKIKMLNATSHTLHTSVVFGEEKRTFCDRYNSKTVNPGHAVQLDRRLLFLVNHYSVIFVLIYNIKIFVQLLLSVQPVSGNFCCTEICFFAYYNILVV
jgi:hypothetical protein